MDNIKDDLQEHGFLYFLAFTPILISFFFRLFLQIPVIGTVWLYAAPFTLLVYWAWVGGAYREKIKSPVRAILVGNIFGIILLLMYIWQFVLLPEGARDLTFAYLSQLFSLPLEFITMWIGLLFEPDPKVPTMVTANIVQFVGFLLMIVAFTIGYFGKKRAEEKKN